MIATSCPQHSTNIFQNKRVKVSRPSKSIIFFENMTSRLLLGEYGLLSRYVTSAPQSDGLSASDGSSFVHEALIRVCCSLVPCNLNMIEIHIYIRLFRASNGCLSSCCNLYTPLAMLVLDRLSAVIQSQRLFLDIVNSK